MVQLNHSKTKKQIVIYNKVTQKGKIVKHDTTSKPSRGGVVSR